MKRKMTFTFTPRKSLKRGENFLESDKITMKTLSDFGVPKTKVAQLFSTSDRSVYRVVENATNKNKNGQGRKKKTTRKQDKKIIKYVKNFPRRSSKFIASKFSKKYGVQISADTVRRRVKDKGGYFGHQKTKYIITKACINSRFDWSYQYFNYKWMRKSIMHDESYFSLNPDSRKSWFFVDQTFGNKKKHWMNLKFECFVSSEWKSKLYFFEGYRDTKHWAQHFDKYYDELKATYKKIRKGEMDFFLDKAPSHLSKAALKFYREKGIAGVMKGFCSKPVEINVCEQIWMRIKKYAWEKNPKTLVDAKVYLEREYGRITRDDLREMFWKVQDRVRHVNSCEGKKTKYWSMMN